jgi:hypothetical protein
MFSASGEGRGPTTLICPHRTLRNCGISSRYVSRRNRPTVVMRGSSAILNWGPSTSLTNRSLS